MGIGTGLGYQTARIGGRIELGGSIFFSSNLFSSDLAVRDPKTGQGNRYEVGLFDIENPASRGVFTRLEKLYATYHFGPRAHVTLGRQLPHSPFINPQDGRLSPTFVEGVIAEWRDSSNTQIQAEFLTRIAPRSTMGWYGVGKSIGLYPEGVDAAGKPAQYAGNVQSDYVIQLGIKKKVGMVSFQLWDTHVQNVFNMLYTRADLVWPSAKKRQWKAGFQLARQWVVGDGGNSQPDKAYNPASRRSLVMSGQLGYQTPYWALYANATRITAEGRFLFPREWGREPFYTFLMRERNEGSGDVTALSSNLFFTPNSRLKFEVSHGYYRLPDVKNYALNKYGLPAYRQTNLGLTYRFNGSLSKFDTQVYWIIKTAVGSSYGNDRYVLNKVGMNQLNIVLNYKI
ncbi:hypothetical protein GCM10007390_17830 [Persicitalea jodogahamensis]|uniref:Outer membrane porin n=2 Tax=Persicitalea jodogahamensis TaxID=402147 RepID=A0A8J3G8E5_9BACT|nr:hypothetical protein GCM10007390_17830 [Persicitalea jodogahamensis]